MLCKRLSIHQGKLRTAAIEFADNQSLLALQMWMDTPATLAIKYAWARRSGYRGVAFWNSGSVRYGPNSMGEAKEMWDAVSAFGPLEDWATP